MPKVEYENIKFDSELEVEYVKYLRELKNKGEVLSFYYHPDAIQNLVGKRSYTPDFLVAYRDRIEIVECKGYNPYSKMIDDQIHNVMLSKTEYFLKSYICEVKARHMQFFCGIEWDTEKKVVYRKVKYLKAYGFVDWDFKNPNTIANKRKEKINEQQDEIKALREFKKNAERYFKYFFTKIDYSMNYKRLTKTQREWFEKYVEELRKSFKEQI